MWEEDKELKICEHRNWLKKNTPSAINQNQILQFIVHILNTGKVLFIIFDTSVYFSNVESAIRINWSRP